MLIEDGAERCSRRTTGSSRSSSTRRRAAQCGTSPARATSISPAASPPARSATRTSGSAAPIAEQAMKLIHVSNLFYNEPQISLRRAICAKRAHAMGRGARVLLQLGRRGQRGRGQARQALPDDVKGQPERIEVLSFEGSSTAAPSPPSRSPARKNIAPASGRSSSGRASCRFPTDENDLPRARRHHRAAPARSSSSRSRPRAASACRRPDFLQGAAAEVHRHRHGAHLRRGADRRRPHRHLLRLRAGGRASPT